MNVRGLLFCDRALCAQKDGYLPLYQAATGWYVNLSGEKAL